MTRLTKKERAAVLRAAEAIERGTEEFSCLALDAVSGRILVRKYSQFFDKIVFGSWAFPRDEYGNMEFLVFSPNAKEIRVLCLLTFAHLG